MVKINELRKTRIKKLEAIKSAGINPYPEKTKRTHRIDEALKGFSKLSCLKKQVILNGRIRSLREHGGSTFLHFEDGTARIQAFFRKNRLGEKSYKFFLDNFDIGDFIEIRGILFKTKRGEKTIEAGDYKMLAKSLLPLPEKWHGLKDIEERYRKRYLDLIFNQEVKEKFILRTKIIKEIRAFLDKKGFLEVETPVLQPIYGGTKAKPFKTHLNALNMDLYLRVAHELYLKRLLVGGFEKVYEIGRMFRNEGMDKFHNPEFTMLDSYWAYADYKDMMKMAENLFKNLLKKIFGKLEIVYEGKKISFKTPWKRIEFNQIIRKYTKINLEEINEKALAKKAKQLGIKLDKGIGKAEIADAIYKKTCRSKIWQPTFVIHHPLGSFPLAKELEKIPAKLANFQLVIAGFETGLCFSELNDPLEQKKRFEEQEKMFKKGFEEAQRIDKDFLEALEYGMPPSAGFGMGIDRLVALLTNSHSLREVILFPTMKSKKETVSNKNGLVKRKAENNYDLGISLGQAEKLLNKYIKDSTTKLHCKESQAIMRGLAKHFGENEEKWGIIGLLHDIDWEFTKDNPAEHTVKAVKILQNAGANDFLIETIASHCYGNEQCGKNKDKKRTTKVQHCLAAAETLTGLIVASALVQPNKKLTELTLKSLKKKFKSKGFASNCDREIIRECEKVGLSLDEFLEIGLKSMQKIAADLGL